MKRRVKSPEEKAMLGIRKALAEFAEIRSPSLEALTFLDEAIELESFAVRAHIYSHVLAKAMAAWDAPTGKLLVDQNILPGLKRSA